MGTIVVVGSINMDLVVNVAAMPKPGETVSSNSFAQQPGGKGANQAVTCAKLGAQTTMIGRLGKDIFGDALYQHMSAVGVEMGCIVNSETAPTGVALITVDATGENSIVLVPGANAEVSEGDILRKRRIIESANVLLAQFEIPLLTVESAFELARSKGVTTILNPAPAYEVSDSLLRNTSIITPNEHELGIVAGVATADLNGIRKAAAALLARGVGAVVVTLGAEGSLAFTRETEIAQNAYPNKAVDTTAAGDSFTGALAVALTEGKELAEALDFASRVASLTITKPGAQNSLPSRAEVEEFIRTGELCT